MYFYFLVPVMVILVVLSIILALDETHKKSLLKYLVGLTSSIMKIAPIVFSVWTLLFVVFIRGSSYYSYLDMVEEQAAVKQRAAAINLYIDKAVTELQAGSGSIRNGELVITKSTELTDFKYANYQKEISSMITGLKCIVVSYNTSLVGKRKMYESRFWSWCIVPPDEDMKLLDIDELFYHGPINN